MEHIREKIAYLGTHIEKYDSLVKDLADTRWVVEMVRLQSQLDGASMAEAMRKAHGSLQHTMDQVARAERVLLKVTGQQTVHDARALMVKLVTAYTRVTILDEAVAFIEAGGEPEVDGVRYNQSTVGHLNAHSAVATAAVDVLAEKIVIAPVSTIDLI